MLTARTRSSRQSYEGWFTGLCRGLQENRPGIKDPYFCFDDDSFPIDDARAQRIGIALRGNTVVKRLRLHVQAMTLVGTTDIAQFIAESPKLNEIYLTCGLVGEGRPVRVAMRVVDRFLEAAAINGKMRELEVPRLFGAHPLANCLRGNRNTLVCLSLQPYRVDIGEEIITQQMLDENEAVAAAIGSLHLLEELTLFESNESSYLAPILPYLVDRPNLRILDLSMADTREEAQHGSTGFARVAPAIRNILQSSTRLQDYFYITNIDGVQNHVGFNVMFEGLSGHSSLQNLNLLCFSKIIEALGTNSTLETLVVRVSKIDDDFEEGSRRLATLLPRVQSLKKLALLGFNSSADKPVGDFLLGFEHNTSLEFISIDSNNHAQAKDILAYYAARNTGAPHVANATTENISMILADVLTQKHGLSVAFGALRERVDLFGGLLEYK